jgi:hypothetical protein
LPVDLYDYENWSTPVREEHRLRVCENRVLRRIFRPKRDAVTRGGGEMHKEEPHSFYSSPDTVRIIRRNRMCKTCRNHGEEEMGMQSSGGKI